jgi:hypothetical protein
MDRQPVPEVRTHAAQLRIAIEMAAEYSEGVMHSYSGRFMYGRRCLGVEVTNPVRFALLVGTFSAQAPDPEVPIAAANGVHWDQMGKDFIVYWPDLEYVTEDD